MSVLFDSQASTKNLQLLENGLLLIAELLRLHLELLNGLVDTHESENHLVESCLFALLMRGQSFHDVLRVDHLQSLGELIARGQVKVYQVLKLNLLLVLLV